jgi:hypothetical protein
VVDSIVRAIIGEIAEGKADVDRICVWRAEDGVEKEIKRSAERNAGAERHDEPVAILREVMMDSVEYEVHAALPRARADIMKYVAM